jgi:prepilin-type N-terminal cleavage/methylation domain-containing protein
VRAKNKRALTLLELIVVIAIVAISASLVAYRMQGAISTKHFTADIERLQTRLTLAQKLALSTQSDWNLRLYQKQGMWILESVSEEGKALAPLKFDSMDIFFNEKKVKEVAFEFFATGKIFPQGTFLFKRGKERQVVIF